MPTYNFPDITSFTLDTTAADIKGIDIRSAERNQTDNVVIFDHTGNSELEVETTDSSLILRRSSSGATQRSSGYNPRGTTDESGHNVSFFHSSPNIPRYDRVDNMVINFGGKNHDRGNTVINQGNIDITDHGVFIDGQSVDDMGSSNTAETPGFIVSIKAGIVLDSLEVLAEISDLLTRTGKSIASQSTLQMESVKGSFPLRQDLKIISSNGSLKFSTLTQPMDASDVRLDAHTNDGSVDIEMTCDKTVLSQRHHNSSVTTSNGDLRGTCLYGGALSNFTTSNGNLDIVIVPSAGVDDSVMPYVATSNGRKNCRVATWI